MITNDPGSLYVLYAVSGIDCCVGSVLVLYNLMALVSFLREDTGGESSGALAKAAWVVGLAALFVLPCGLFLGPLAMILSSVERRRIYAEQAPLAGLTPCRMGSVNGGIATVLALLGTVGSVASWMM